jgi:hypothetical protein
LRGFPDDRVIGPNFVPWRLRGQELLPRVRLNVLAFAHRAKPPRCRRPGRVLPHAPRNTPPDSTSTEAVRLGHRQKVDHSREQHGRPRWCDHPHRACHGLCTRARPARHQ